LGDDRLVDVADAGQQLFVRGIWREKHLLSPTNCGLSRTSAFKGNIVAITLIFFLLPTLLSPAPEAFQNAFLSAFLSLTFFLEFVNGSKRRADSRLASEEAMGWSG
jgi:hypothetical protein